MKDGEKLSLSVYSALLPDSVFRVCFLILFYFLIEIGSDTTLLLREFLFLFRQH